MPIDCHIKELQQRIALYEDMKAYHELYNIFSKKLHRFCYSFLKTNEASEEIVSDVFIKIWQIRTKLNTIDNLAVYLYTIAKNFSLNYITKNFKNPVVSLDQLDIEAFINIGTPEDICVSSSIMEEIQKAIQQLPPQCRLIFQMVKEDELKYKEVAAVLNISVLTVRNQLAIAVKKMADALPAYILEELKINR